MKYCLLICVCIFAYSTTMNTYSKNFNQNSADVENSEQILGTKIQNEPFKCLMESNNDNTIPHHDLKNLVMSQNQNQNKSQNEQQIGTVNNADEPNFEQPSKKIKFEDQSGEIQRLNQIIKNLKEDNSKLSKMNAELVTKNDHLEKVKKQNKVGIKDLKWGQKNQSERIDALHSIRKNKSDQIELLQGIVDNKQKIIKIHEENEKKQNDQIEMLKGLVERSQKVINSHEKRYEKICSLREKANLILKKEVNYLKLKNGSS